MPLFQLECETEGREIYEIAAQSESEAKDMLFNNAPKPVVSEVISIEVISVKEVMP